MEYRTLGNTGTVVSTLCLGTMTFGTESDEQVAHQQLDRFLEQGGNFIDTADVYSRGTSEEIVGRWLKNKRRDDFVIATKVRFGMGDGPNEVGVSRQYNALLGRAKAIPFFRTEDYELDGYVVGKALDGLFLVVGQEERKIRTNPAARVTDLLKEVFAK